MHKSPKFVLWKQENRQNNISKINQDLFVISLQNHKHITSLPHYKYYILSDWNLVEMHLWIIDEVPCPQTIGFMKMVYIKGHMASHVAKVTNFLRSFKPKINI